MYFGGAAPFGFTQGRLNQVAAATAPQIEIYSLHIGVRAFTVFSDEALDARCDNGQRHRAEL